MTGCLHFVQRLIRVSFFLLLLSLQMRPERKNRYKEHLTNTNQSSYKSERRTHEEERTEIIINCSYSNHDDLDAALQCICGRFGRI